MPAYSRRIQEALEVAARAHRTQLRKGTDVPYITHPVQVGWILGRHGFDEDLVLAGILHDTVEDTDVSLADLATRFGDGVAELVADVTEKKAEDGHKRPWRVRKEEQLAHLAGASARVAALKAADALHNAASTLADVQRGGVATWDRFNAGAKDSVWYYSEIARIVGERLGDHPLARELAETVAALSESARP